MTITRIVLAVAIFAVLLVGTVIGVAAIRNGNDDPGGAVPADPTAIPTITPPARVPPPPDQLRNPSPAPEEPTPAFEVLLPAASEIKLDDAGRYYADGAKGCPWTESSRARSIDRMSEEILFTNTCDDEVFLRYSPATGKTTLFAQ